MRLILGLFVFLSLGTSFAGETIRFPDEELENETVLPVFENKSVVLNRLVKSAGHFEVGGGIGFNLTEALYNNLNFNALAAYNFTELHSAHFAAFAIMDGLSETGKDLRAGKGLNGLTFDASRAPHAKNVYLANYQINAYYGKISLGKRNVINLSLFGQAGIGAVNFGSDTKPAFDLGFGQKFYFTRKSALRVDFRFLFCKGPDPTTASLPTGGSNTPSFSERVLTYTLLTVGYVFVL